MSPVDDYDDDDDDLLMTDPIAEAKEEQQRRNCSAARHSGISSEEERGGIGRGGGNEEEEERRGVVSTSPADAAAPALITSQEIDSTSNIDDEGSGRDDYEGKYTITPLVDLERLKWTKEGDAERGLFWVPVRVMTMNEIALEQVGEGKLPEGKVWVRYFPTKDTDKKQHKVKKEADLIPFNYGEEGGALRWSSYYKAMAPRPPKSKDKKNVDSSQTNTTLADAGPAANDNDDHDDTVTVSANGKKIEKKKKGRRPAKRMAPKKPPIYTHAQWSKSMQYAEMTLQDSLTVIWAKKDQIQRERQLAASLAVVTPDEEEEEGGCEVERGQSEVISSLYAQSPTLAGKRKGRGNVVLQLGDRIQFKSRLEKAGTFYEATVIGIDPPKQKEEGGIPLTLRPSAFLDVDVHVQKVAKYNARRGTWKDVPEGSRKFMALREHDMGKKAVQADEKLLSLLAPSMAAQVKKVMAEEQARLNEDIRLVLC